MNTEIIEKYSRQIANISYFDYTEIVPVMEYCMRTSEYPKADCLDILKFSEKYNVTVSVSLLLTKRVNEMLN